MHRLSLSAHGRVLAAAACLAALAGACASAPPALRAPRVDAGVEHFEGSALAAPRGARSATDADPEAPWRTVACRVVYLEHLPETELDPLTTRTRLVVSRWSARPLDAAARLAIGARIGTGEPATAFLARLAAGRVARSAPAAFLEGTIAPGRSTSFAISEAGRVESTPSGAVVPHVALVAERVGGDAPAIRVTLLVEGVVELPATANASEGPAPRSELLAIDEPIGEDALPLVLLVPSPFRGIARGAFAFVLEPAAETSDARPPTAADLARAGRLASTAGAPMAEAGLVARALRLAFDALAERERRRAALVFLGSATGARLAEDLATVAGEALLDELLASARFEMPDRMELSEDPPLLGWLLESAAYGLVARAETEGRLSESMRGVLYRHAGEAGRSPATILEMVADSHDLREFADHLADENRLSLEDGDPVARVRAFDWLASRGLEPPGFDPLAPARTRREALRRAQDARDEEAAARAEGPPSSAPASRTTER